MTDASPPATKALVTLGIRLKRVRERSGRSLRDVARQLGMSASFLSQMERGKSQPSVATLYSLAQFLGVSIDELFAADDDDHDGTASPEAAGSNAAPPSHPAPSSPYVASPVSRSQIGTLAGAWPRDQAVPRLSVTRPGERHALEMDSGVIWERLVENTGAGLDFIEIIYPPQSGSTNDQRMLRHSGWEFGWLIEGELEITVGFEHFTLRAGEAVGFDSAIPHLLANKTDRVARGIWCVRHGY